MAISINGGYYAVPLTSFPSSAAPAAGVTSEAVLRELYDQSEKSITSTAATIAVATVTIFTVAGGPIEVLNLISNCVTTDNTNGTTIQWTFDGTNGSATTFTGLSGSLASLVAGDMVIADLTLLTTVPASMSTGISGALGSPVTQRFFVTNGPGVIQLIGGTAVTTGTWSHSLRYRPLGRGVTVTAI